jgi:hypothetical protein
MIPLNYLDTERFLAELRYLIKEEMFDVVKKAIEISQKPLISREEALTIIPVRSLERGVKLGHLIKLRHGRRVYFDRLRFQRYITLIAPDKVKP